MRGTRSALLVALLLASGCAGEPPTPAEPAPARVLPDATSVAALVADSWARAAATDPASVEALLGAPGGDGWLKLFHGDLAGAASMFSGPASGTGAEASSARLGMARVHLARAAYLSTAADLHAAAALELARYRRDRPDQVRAGAYDRLAAALAATAVQPAPSDRAGFVTLLETAAQGGDPAVVAGLTALVAARSSGDPALAEPPAGIPEVLARRLRMARSVALGAAPEAEDLRWGAAAFVDPRGVDEATGVRFEEEVYDAVPVRAAARAELAQAWAIAAGLGDAGALVRDAVEARWGGPVPVGVRTSARPGGHLPAWAALFVSRVADPADWRVAWGGEGTSFADRWEDVFATRVDGDSPMQWIDRLLRGTEDRRLLVQSALVADAPEAGASLVVDLGLAGALADRVLRTRMVDLVAQGHAAPAKRLADRSLDPNPGSKGGAADSAETRVSYRNDRAFLIELAGCLHAAGQTGAALSYVHPLAKEDPRLRGLEHYLGRLDAAASIGTGGKASQL